MRKQFIPFNIFIQLLTALLKFLQSITYNYKLLIFSFLYYLHYIEGLLYYF